jgi:hypothetical protein
MAETERIELLLTAQNQISGKLDEVVASLQKVKKEGKTSTDSLSSMVQNLGSTFGKFLAPAAIGAGLAYAVSEAAASEVALNQLKGAVVAVGGSWEDTNKTLTDYATNLANTTSYTDEEAMGVMQRLITVTGNSTDSWKAAGLVLDIASTGLMNTEGAAKAVAMAMEGNVQALGRFVPELKGANLKLLEGKSAAEKAEYAMSMLQEKFGGRAANEMNTYTGQVKLIQKTLGEMAEDIGKVIIPVLAGLATALNTALGASAARDITSSQSSINKGMVNIAKNQIKLINLSVSRGLTDRATADTQIKAQQDVIAQYGGEVIALNKIASTKVDNSKTDKELAKDAKADYDSRLTMASVLDERLSVLHIKSYKNQLATLKQGVADSRTADDDKIKYKNEIKVIEEKMITDSIALRKANYVEDYNNFKTYNVDAIVSGTWTIQDAMNTVTRTIAKQWLDVVFTPISMAAASFMDSMSVGLAPLAGAFATAGLAAWNMSGSIISAFATTSAGMLGYLGVMLANMVLYVNGLLAGAAASIMAWGFANAWWSFGGTIAAAVVAVAGMYAGIASYVGAIHLAEGGIVTSPTMALIGEGGEPEAVIPLSKLDKMTGGGGGVNIEAGAFIINGVNFANEGQKKSVAQEIASYIFDYQNQTRPAYRRAL